MATEDDEARREAGLRAFRTELEALSDAEIRRRLDSRLIRNVERRSIAEAILRRRAAGAPPPLAEGTATSPGPGGIEPAEGEAGEGKEPEARVPAMVGAVPAEVPVARRIGRALGIALAIGSMILLAIGIMRLAG